MADVAKRWEKGSLVVRATAGLAVPAAKPAAAESAAAGESAVLAQQRC